MKKQTLFTLLLAIAAMMWVDSASAQSIKISDMEINLTKDASLTGDWLKSGTVEWIATTKTLVLEDANIVSEGIGGSFIRIYRMEGITILLLGENSINNTHIQRPISFINSKGTIIGGGSLKTETKDDIGLYIFESTVTLIGCSVETNENIGNKSTYNSAKAHIVDRQFHGQGERFPPHEDHQTQIQPYSRTTKWQNRKSYIPWRNGTDNSL